MRAEPATGKTPAMCLKDSKEGGYRKMIHGSMNRHSLDLTAKKRLER
jgi:hypothetical protein